MSRASSDDTHDSDQERLLRDGFEAGIARYGRLELRFEDHAAHARRLVRTRLAKAGIAANPERVRAELACLEHADLYLASACTHGATSAWERLVTEYRPRLFGLAFKRSGDPARSEETALNVLSDLVLVPGSSGAASRLSTFDGSGTLFAWLAAILSRRLTDRGPGRDRPPDAADGIAKSEDSGPDPAESAQTDELGQRFAAGLARAWCELTDQEKLAIQAKHEQGLKQHEIARLLGVGPPRVSRILAHALATIRAGVERALPGVSWDELLPAWGSMRDRIGLHLATFSPPRPHAGDEASPQGPPRET